MSRIDFATALNEEQYAAVTAADGPALILAAAGTGKTRTLVHRVAYLVEQGAAADRILLLTFTNRAAREMLERASELVGDGVSGLWGGTFHHMANRVLRRHASTLGFPNDFTILDRDDSMTLVRQAIREFKLNRKEFPKANVLLGLLGWAVNTETPLREVIEERFGDGQVHDVDVDGMLRVLERYNERKRELASMDFDDLLVNALRLFQQDEGLRARYSEQFQYILVDEYQDTNILQAEIVDILAARHRNCFVVGDDFQSIYSWRGADYRNILSFPERYADTQVYKLETNYRSVPEILKVANACIAGNPEQFQKTMHPTREDHMRPVLVRMRDGMDQARWVHMYIQHCLREGYKPQEIAVLYRAHFHAMDLQLHLTHEGTPYVITSGIRFFEQAHVKDACSVVRIACNAEDEMAFSRLLEMLPGVGPRTGQKIWARLGRRFDVFSAEARAGIRDLLPSGARNGWQDIESCLPDPGGDGAFSGSQLVDNFSAAFYENYAAETYEDHRRRIDDVREMALFMDRFDTIEDFLSEAALLTNVDAEMAADEDPSNAIRLSTVHQAKGLEWRVVLLLWSCDGMFPATRSLNESESAEAEERRLFYVAITRAQDELIFCAPEMRRVQGGGVMYTMPSRFVEEIPPELLEVRRT